MTVGIRTKPRAVEVDLAVAPPMTPDTAAWSEFFDGIYRESGGDAAQIPWAEGRPNPALQEWLNDVAPGLVRPGATAVVVGCGLGDDARELFDRGYEVTAFDVSPTAVELARQRHADLADRIANADLFALPPSMLRRADLVVEIYTIQALHPELRPRAAAAVASLARPRGTILTVCRARADDEPLSGPPFPLTARELTDLFAPHGFAPTDDVEECADESDPALRRLRAAFRRC